MIASDGGSRMQGPSESIRPAGRCVGGDKDAARQPDARPMGHGDETEASLEPLPLQHGVLRMETPQNEI